MERIKTYIVPIVGILVLVVWYLFFRPKLENDAPFDGPTAEDKNRADSPVRTRPKGVDGR